MELWRSSQCSGSSSLTVGRARMLADRARSLFGRATLLFGRRLHLYGHLAECADPSSPAGSIPGRAARLVKQALPKLRVGRGIHTQDFLCGRAESTWSTSCIG